MRKAKRFARPANSRGFVFGIDFIGKVRKRDLAEGEGFVILAVAGFVSTFLNFAPHFAPSDAKR